MTLKKLLAIETSGKICSVALCNFDSISLSDNMALESELANFEVIAEYNINIGNRHDKFCAELCHRILKDNDVAVGTLACVAVSVGPGSFTGLRIGLSVAKGLCFDDGGDLSEVVAPHLIAVPTLNAIALKGVNWLLQKDSEQNSSFKATAKGCGVIDSPWLLAVIHSHSNLFYHQLFDINGVSISDISFSDIASIETQFADKFVYIGTNSKADIGFGIYRPQLSYLTAEAIGKLGAIQFIRRQFVDSTDIQPLYVQDFVPNYGK